MIQFSAYRDIADVISAVHDGVRNSEIEHTRMSGWSTVDCGVESFIAGEIARSIFSGSGGDLPVSIETNYSDIRRWWNQFGDSWGPFPGARISARYDIIVWALSNHFKDPNCKVMIEIPCGVIEVKKAKGVAEFCRISRYDLERVSNFVNTFCNILPHCFGLVAGIVRERDRSVVNDYLENMVRELGGDWKVMVRSATPETCSVTLARAISATAQV